MSAPRAVGLLGGGVIGGGWAARFLLGGTDVRLYDPDPEAERKLGEMLGARAPSARAAVGGAAAARGHPDRRADAGRRRAEGVELVQESAPERLELKQALLAEAARRPRPDVLIASSTSGLRPTALAAEMGRPERFLVAHPFNPVYLLPLVELCGGERTAPETIERARALYRSLGMAPLVVRKEIDGFVADRMLEALWREALWLVNDGVATVAEVDDAIRLGAGPALVVHGHVPDLPDRRRRGRHAPLHGAVRARPEVAVDEADRRARADRRAARHDRRAVRRAGRGPQRARARAAARRLPRLRAAGAARARHRRRRRARAATSGRSLRPHRRACWPTATISRSRWPCTRPQVAPDWVDYNGHAHESRYLQVFGDASDALFGYLGIDADYLARGSYFTVESHLSHLREALLDDRLAVTTQVLDCDARRLHVFHSLWREGDGALLATAEQLFLHVDTVAGARRPRGRWCSRACSASPRRTLRCRAPSAPVARSGSRLKGQTARPRR